MQEDNRLEKTNYPHTVRFDPLVFPIIGKFSGINKFYRIFQDGHDCMDAEGRATQEAKAEDKPKYTIQSYVHF